jgi:hypothetical protein
MSFEPYPVGSRVRILQPKAKPSNWNYEMLALVGEESEVVGNSAATDKDKYGYLLHRWRWNWRHIDLELVSEAKPEPNQAFWMRKRGIF